MKSLPLLFLALVSLAQWAAPLWQIRQFERTLSHGTLIRLQCQAPDPYDPLRGRYLAVRPQLNGVPIAPGSTFQAGQQACLTLDIATDGLATLKELHASPPASGDYMHVTYEWAWDGKARISWPFSRFYLNETLAPEADRWFAERVRDAKGVYAEVRLLDGQAVLQDLTFDGRPLRDLVKEHMRQAQATSPAPSAP